ncbi:MAG: hypothetical protein ACREUC_12870 [Steroidobacteraceae bacterium]
MLGHEAFCCLDGIRSSARRSCDGAHELNIVAESRHEFRETLEMRHRLLARSVRHERSIGERPRDSGIDIPEFANNRVELREVTPRARNGVGGVKSGVENRPRDRRIGGQKLLEKIFDLLCRELGKRHDDLTLDEANVILQPVNVAPKQHTESAPRTHVADCSRAELENKLKRDAVGQALRQAAAVFDRPGDIPAQGCLRVS